MTADALTVAEFQAEAQALCEVGRLFGHRQWCLATGGNFSLRVDDQHLLITRSGTDKAFLAADGLMLCDLDGAPADRRLRPSAETALHVALYALDDGAGAVLHTHSVTSTVLSRAATNDLVIEGFEMQKAIEGIASHEERLILPVLENGQDMRKLATLVRERYALGQLRARGFLVRGHGLYAWGDDLESARRHLEGLEFLLACLWQERLLSGRTP
ncbi:MAG TPA: methylthioribulose 1-phosphate dehydratase [Woeseiaceae bacterium]|nr:methylthioribulose 1-phosphate dehydratase [Woeseiaceae bacterium]